MADGPVRTFICGPATNATLASEPTSSPDPNHPDPETAQPERIKSLELTELRAARMPEIAALVRAAESTDEALTSVARLLDADEVEVEVLIRLARFDILSLTASSKP